MVMTVYVKIIAMDHVVQNPGKIPCLFPNMIIATCMATSVFGFTKKQCNMPRLPDFVRARAVDYGNLCTTEKFTIFIGPT